MFFDPPRAVSIDCIKGDCAIAISAGGITGAAWLAGAFESGATRTGGVLDVGGATVLEALNDATLPAEANIERIMASAICDDDWGTGKLGGSAVCASSAMLGAGFGSEVCGPNNRLTRLLNPA